MNVWLAPHVPHNTVVSVLYEMLHTLSPSVTLCHAIDST
jgi:hypothetical protein